MCFGQPTLISFLVGFGVCLHAGAVFGRMWNDWQDERASTSRQPSASTARGIQREASREILRRRAGSWPTSQIDVAVDNTVQDPRNDTEGP